MWKKVQCPGPREARQASLEAVGTVKQGPGPAQSCGMFWACSEPQARRQELEGQGLCSQKQADGWEPGRWTEHQTKDQANRVGVKIQQTKDTELSRKMDSNPRAGALAFHSVLVLPSPGGGRLRTWIIAVVTGVTSPPPLRWPSPRKWD